MAEHITYSFIIPVKPGGTVKALEALHMLAADATQFEILVVEGSKPSLQRNHAAREARGEILYFLDDDSCVSPDCLALCSSLFSAANVAAVGGPSLTPPTDTSLQKLFGTALSSLFGAGGMRNRYRRYGNLRETTDKELILCNLAFKRSVFLETGGLDERLYPNEENELLDRIQASGMKLLHQPDIAVYRSQRGSIRQFARQMFSYGRGRAQQTLITGKASPIGFIPLMFVLYLLALPFSTTMPVLFLPLCCYIVLNLGFTAAAVATGASPQALLLIFLFPLMHICNGWGLLSGLFGGRNGNSKLSGNTGITIRRVKEFGQNEW